LERLAELHLSSSAYGTILLYSIIETGCQTPVNKKPSDSDLAFLAVAGMFLVALTG
jgi:hypothetical protein